MCGGWIAYYLCTNVTIDSGLWGQTGIFNQIGRMGRVTNKTIIIDGKAQDPSPGSLPFVEGCLMPNWGGGGCISLICSYLSLYMVCSGDVLPGTGIPLACGGGGSPASKAQVYFLGQTGFSIGFPDANCAIISSFFRSQCFTACNGIDQTLTSMQSAPVVTFGTDLGKVGAFHAVGFPGSDDYELHICDKPHYDKKGINDPDIYYGAKGHVLNSDFGDKTYGKYWRDMTRDPTVAGA